MEHPRNLAAAPSTLLYQPRFDCRSGGLVAAQLYACRGATSQSVTLGDLAGLESAALRAFRDWLLQAAREYRGA